MRNLHRRFDLYYIGQISSGDFAKFCGLLRIYELYCCFGNKSLVVKLTLINDSVFPGILMRRYAKICKISNLGFIKKNVKLVLDPQTHAVDRLG